MSPSYPIPTAQSEKRGLIVPLFLPLIHEDAIEQLHSSLFVFLSLLYISIDPEFKVEIQSSVGVCTDGGSLQQYLKEMKRQSGRLSPLVSK